MQKGLITIILPIYNVEKYLDRSIESVLSQTYKELEVILVDDGSTDTCSQKCDQWKARDQRIKVIHKENGGLGEARNTGLENASGEYVCFFDSDDYVDPKMIEKAYECVKRNAADIVFWGVNEVSASGKITGAVPQTEKELYVGAEVQEVILPGLLAAEPETGKRLYLRMSAWACMFSMEKIQLCDWRFMSERKYISEDVISLLYLYRYIDRVAIIPECLYFYCENENSLSHIYRKDRFEKIKYCYDACLDVCDRSGYGQDVKERLGFWYYACVVGMIKILMLCKDKKECITEIEQISQDPHFDEVIKRLRFRKEPLGRKIIYAALRSKNSIWIYRVLKLRALLKQ